MKREYSSHGYTQGTENVTKRSRKEDKFEVRLLIPSKIVGAIIGKSGSNIKKMRDDNNATIRIPNCDGPERVMTIQADDGKTVIEIIRQTLQSISKDNLNKDLVSNNHSESNENEIRLLVHESIVGGIIGKAGSKIKHVRETSGAFIKVYGTCAPQSTDRCVSIQGLIENICSALKEIFEVTESTEIKGGNRPYDPSYFDAIYANEYGGFGSEKELQNYSNRGSIKFHNSNQFSTGYPYQYGFLTGQYQNNFNAIWSENNNEYQNNLNAMWPENNNTGDNENAGTVKTTQVTIPKDMGGAIIGKGGSRIGRIRQDSNAIIKILEAKEGAEERIISITGTDRSIQIAQYLLQQCVKENYKQL